MGNTYRDYGRGARYEHIYIYIYIYIYINLYIYIHTYISYELAAK